MIVGLEEEAHLSEIFSYKVSDFVTVDCLCQRPSPKLFRRMSRQHIKQFRILKSSVVAVLSTSGSLQMCPGHIEKKVTLCLFSDYLLSTWVLDIELGTCFVISNTSL